LDAAHTLHGFANYMLKKSEPGNSSCFKQLSSLQISAGLP
jgi:hypothetical protein